MEQAEKERAVREAEGIPEPENWEAKYGDLRRFHNALVVACNELEIRERALIDKVTFLTTVNEGLGRALENNKEIMRNALTKQNEDAQEFITEINVLRAKIKELEAETESD